MKALRKLLITGRIANEAGIMLDGLVQQRRQVVDEKVRQADAAKKRERQRPGFLQRAMVYDARPMVDTCVQADGAGEINIRENSVV
jgi:hypothetical protein